MTNEREDKYGDSSPAARNDNDFPGRLFGSPQMAEDESIPVGSGEPETGPAVTEEASVVAEDAAVDAVDAAAARAETVEVGEDESEETPVIDVHAAHGGIHMWKDFWIHLGTITLGLLIAISLEQGVEALHRVHERHQLEADLREEGEQNAALAENDWRVIDDRMAASAARLREVESTLAGRSKIDPPFPAPSFKAPPLTANDSFVMPLSTVWTTAKEGALIDLLPREVARSYTRLYLQVDLLQQMSLAADGGGNEVKAYECRFSDGALPCKPDLSQMTDEQLGEYSGLLTRYFTLLQVAKGRALNFESINAQVLDGRNLERRNGALQKLKDEHPDTFLRPVPGESERP